MMEIPQYTNLRKQQGMVLILAMLIVALVTSLVVATSWKFELGMSRNENRWHGLQARLFIESGERLVGKLLLIPDLDDQMPDGQADHINEDWNQELIPPQQQDDPGQIAIRMSDAQARFNLNLLSLKAEAPPPNTPQATRCEQSPKPFDCEYTVAQRRFIRFLQVIPLNERLLTPYEATEITDAIIDWVDADHQMDHPGGAEQSYYQGLEVPIVVSNAPMTTVSELSLVKGITPELYERLLPYVIALPAEGNTAGNININTIPDIMFRMFNDKAIREPLDEQLGSDLAQARNDTLNIESSSGQGYQSVEDFVNQDLASILNLTASDFDSSQLSIDTQYFIYDAVAEIGDKVRRGKTLMFRDKQKRIVVSLWRTDANF